MDVIQLVRVVVPVVSAVSKIPWERMQKRDVPRLSELLPEELKARPMAVPPHTPEPTHESTHESTLEKPGCTAADESGVVLYHLQGLAAGKPGFGVLATDVQRLERAALGAEGMGDAALAQKLRGFTGKLPEITDADTAAVAAEELKLLADESWELGRRCGGGVVSDEMMSKATALAEKVKSGEITRVQAVEELRKEAIG